MTTRLLLVRHATTADTRRAAFPATTGATASSGCAGLDRAGAVQAAGLRPHLPQADAIWSSHARRAVQTAEALGLDDPMLDADLAEGDFGRWAGHAPTEVHARDPDGLAAWYADPAAAPHGGETLDQIRVRAIHVLGRAAQAGGVTVAVTHGGFIKAALLEVLGLPAAALWRFDAAPCSVTELHPAAEGWRIVRLNWSPRLPGLAA